LCPSEIAISVVISSSAAGVISLHAVSRNDSGDGWIVLIHRLRTAAYEVPRAVKVFHAWCSRRASLRRILSCNCVKSASSENNRKDCITHPEKLCRVFCCGERLDMRLRKTLGVRNGIL